jgi:hypothetical protein
MLFDCATADAPKAIKPQRTIDLTGLLYQVEC